MSKITQKADTNSQAPSDLLKKKAGGLCQPNPGSWVKTTGSSSRRPLIPIRRGYVQQPLVMCNSSPEDPTPFPESNETSATQTYMKAKPSYE